MTVAGLVGCRSGAAGGRRAELVDSSTAVHTTLQCRPSTVTGSSRTGRTSRRRRPSGSDPATSWCAAAIAPARPGVLAAGRLGRRRATGTWPAAWTPTTDAASTRGVNLTILLQPPPPNQPPTAAFTTTCDHLQCTFVNGSTDLDGAITSYTWDFGDGSGDTAENPVPHDYANPGQYDVKLTVTDGDNDSARDAHDRGAGSAHRVRGRRQGQCNRGRDLGQVPATARQATPQCSSRPQRGSTRTWPPCRAGRWRTPGPRSAW
jgi:hypothetical protein